MYGFLRTGKWVALTLLMVFVVPLSVLAADWQYNRWEARKAFNAAFAATSTQAPVPITDVITVDQPVTSAEEWRPVTATGTYIGDATVLVRRQVVQGRTGFIVATPLLTTAGDIVVVERGFTPLPAAGSQPTVPPAPSGTVQIIGRLRPVPDGDGPVRPDDLPSGQVNRLDPLAIATAAGAPGFSAVVELTGSLPEESATLTPLPAPEITEGPHLSYVGQWALIGLASIVIWVILVRREAQHQRETADASV